MSIYKKRPTIEVSRLIISILYIYICVALNLMVYCFLPSCTLGFGRRMKSSVMVGFSSLPWMILMSLIRCGRNATIGRQPRCAPFVSTGLKVFLPRFGMMVSV